MKDPGQARGRTVVRRAAGIAVLGGFALAAAGCFTDAPTLKVVAREEFPEGQPPRFSFDQSTYVIPAGDVNVVLAYPAPEAPPPAGLIPHTLVIEGSDALDLAVDATTRADEQDLALEPGVYTLYCDVVNPQTGVGHRDLGMEAQLLVV